MFTHIRLVKRMQCKWAEQVDSWLEKSSQGWSFASESLSQMQLPTAPVFTPTKEKKNRKKSVEEKLREKKLKGKEEVQASLGIILIYMTLKTSSEFIIGK